MSDKIIDGQRLKQLHLQRIKNQVQTLERKPGLAILLIGQNPNSKLYVKLKKRACEYCDIDLNLYLFEENHSENEIIKTIQFLNQDPETDGILVQLPLPERFDTDKIISSIDYRKDIDGYHPTNRINMKKCSYTLLPPLPAGIIELVNSTGEKIIDKNICILCNHLLFADPFFCEWQGKNKIQAVTFENKNWKQTIKEADLLIVSVGLPFFIDKDMIKEQSIIIDVGINSMANGEVVGDVNIANVIDKVKFITPVPGGVGPMTVATLLDNLVKLAISKKRP